MDLRAPLPPFHCPSSSSSPFPSTNHHHYYTKLTHGLLCRMYIASNVMELGSESRFTSLILFHRYVRHFYVLVAASASSSSASSDASSSREMSKRAPFPTSSMKPTSSTNNNKREDAQTSEIDRKRIQNHLGKVAAACLYLGCKMEEEARRIRDVINVSHVLQFSTWEDHDDDDYENNDEGDDCVDDSKPAASVELKQPAKTSTKIIAETSENAITATPTAPATTSTQPSSNEKSTNPHTTNNSITTTKYKPPLITIRETKYPPPLDENYWNAKENTVSIEQQVLRMLQFDTLVCHPHRCVLVVMDTLGFGTIDFSSSISTSTATSSSSSRSSTYLLTPQQSEQIIQLSFQIINESSLDVTGAVLQFPVVTLTCASIALAADLFVEPGLGKDTGMNDVTNFGEGGNGARKKDLLPAYWWRALDVDTVQFREVKSHLRRIISYR